MNTGKKSDRLYRPSKTELLVFVSCSHLEGCTKRAASSKVVIWTLGECGSCSMYGDTLTQTLSTTELWSYPGPSHPSARTKPPTSKTITQLMYAM